MIKHRITFIKETELDEYAEYIKCNPNTNSNSITFDTNIYINEILKSYNTKMSLYNQFEVDCPRSNIKINGMSIKNTTDFCTNLSKFKDININNHMINSMCDLLKLITLQSSFCFPYILLSNLYCKDHNLVLSSTNYNRRIDININTEYIYIVLNCGFVVKQYKDNIDKNVIKCTLYLKSKRKCNDIIKMSRFLDIENILCQTSLLTWTLVK